MVKLFTRILINLEYAVIIIPLVIAGSQIYFSKVETLSSWKGGGFGMYTDPNPINYRIAFLINDDANNNWIRVYPLDERLEHQEFNNESYLKQMERIHRTVRNRITFPSLMDEKTLIEAIKQLQVDWEGLEEAIFYPADTVNLRVLEVGLSLDYKTMKSTVIYESQLCIGN